MFCSSCGAKLEPGANACSNCGKMAAQGQGTGKNRVVVGLLAIFLGSLGIHNFYLGYKSKAIAQLVTCTAGILVCGLGPIVAAIWALVEGIMVFSGSINQDAQGVPFVD